MKKFNILMLAAASLFFSSLASADTAESIGSAFTAGQSNLGLVATGVIGLAAIMTGVGIVVRWLGR